jgi:hypothetical protein
MKFLVNDYTVHRRRPLQWATACLYLTVVSKFIFLFGCNLVQQICIQYAETLVEIEKIMEKRPYFYCWCKLNYIYMFYDILGGEHTWVNSVYRFRMGVDDLQCCCST